MTRANPNKPINVSVNPAIRSTKFNKQGDEVYDWSYWRRCNNCFLRVRIPSKYCRGCMRYVYKLNKDHEEHILDLVGRDYNGQSAEVEAYVREHYPDHLRVANKIKYGERNE